MDRWHGITLEQEKPSVVNGAPQAVPRPVFIPRELRAKRQAKPEAITSEQPCPDRPTTKTPVSSSTLGYLEFGDVVPVSKRIQHADPVTVAPLCGRTHGRSGDRNLSRLIASSHWDDSDDTSAAVTAETAITAQFVPHNGTGRLAGFDEEYQLHVQRTWRPELGPRVEMALSALSERRSLPSRLHWSTKSLEQMTPRDWRIFREDHAISARGAPPIPLPIRTWSEGGLPEWVIRAAAERQYREMTPVQMQAIPAAMSGRDVIGLAETGSGKTVAYAVPILISVLSAPTPTAGAEGGPRALVLAPTRELAQQIEADIEAFAMAAPSPVRTVALVGGVDSQLQITALHSGCEVVVATPGRLLDLLQQCHISLGNCRTLVLDEGDQMIDLGFEPQLLQVLSAMPVVRTTLIFSATMPPAMERIATAYCRCQPVTVTIGERGRTVDRIEQAVEVLRSDSEKLRRLVELLERGPPPPVMVFVNQRLTCDTIANTLSRRLRVSVAALHSGRTQEAREAAIEAFRSRRVDVLVATNVAGRGLDIQGVTHVINYDMPKTIQEYTHRIGRTGRAGRTGLATSLLSPDDADIAPALRSVLIKAGAKVPRELAQLAGQATRDTTLVH